ncbi:putative mitochondrial protein [Tanacetum coccineum]
MEANRQAKLMMVITYAEVFVVLNKLPPKRTHDHKIPLIPGTPPVNIRPYKHPPVHKDAFEKKDNSWRMCVDYRQLNKQAIKDKFPITIIEELIDELCGAVIFTKLDLRLRYHQISIFEDDIAKTTFKNHEGHYEFLVMPFGLTDAPSTFQALMNEVFREYLRKFTLVFFDDILVYSKSLEDHILHLTAILFKMKDHSLYAKESKCVFGTSHVVYLGHVLSAEGVATDPAKIQVMQTWPILATIKQLRGFLGLTGYYRRFIRDFASISRPLTQLLNKNSFKWSEEAHQDFVLLKEAMVQASVLALLGFSKSFMVETDASRVGLGVTSREYLLDRHFVIKTDHYSLKYLLDQNITTLAQIKWLPELMGFDYEVVYKKGKDNAAADALSRREVTTGLKKGEVKKNYALLNNQLLRKGKLVVGNNASLRQDLLFHYHKSAIGGHSGTEVVNRCLEGYLRCMTGEHPKEWFMWIPLAELWYNSNYHSTINTTPFAALYGQAPPVHVPYVGGLSKVDAIDRSLTAREQAIEVGTMAYKLKLLVESQIHDVFHVSQLKKFHGSRQLLTPLMLPQINKEGLLEVVPVKILDRKIVKKNNVAAVY